MLTKTAGACVNALVVDGPTRRDPTPLCGNLMNQHGKKPLIFALYRVSQQVLSKKPFSRKSQIGEIRKFVKMKEVVQCLARM